MAGRALDRPAKAALRGPRTVWRRLRFRAWVWRAKFELRRNGGRLVVEAPHGATFDSAPAIKSMPEPEGGEGGTLTLRFGRDVHLGRGMTIEVWARGDNVLEAGDRTAFLDGVRIALRTGSVRFGVHCQIRDGVWLKADGELTVGDEATISHHSAVHCTEKIDIEEYVGLGDRVSIVDSDHTFTGDDVHYMTKPITTTPIRIGRNSMVAIGAVVLRGVSLGPNSVVASNAVVRGGEYPPGAILGGNPAKVIKSLGDAETPSLG